VASINCGTTGGQGGDIFVYDVHSDGPLLRTFHFTGAVDETKIPQQCFDEAARRDAASIVTPASAGGSQTASVGATVTVATL